MFKTLLTSLDNDVLTITVNRPDKLNALNNDVFTDLENVIAKIESDTGIRSAIITGAGPRAFIAGADIGELRALNKQQAISLAKRGQGIFQKIEDCRKPVIAAVNGFALGGGCELSMACHFRIAGDNAKFGQPEVNLGVIPGYGGTQRLVQLIGKGRALELLMTGNMIEAQQALQYGLVNYVVPQEELFTKTKTILDQIIKKAPLAISRCITAANAVFGSENGFD